MVCSFDTSRESLKFFSDITIKNTYLINIISKLKFYRHIHLEMQILQLK
jgi:hypothetical protein